jgi:ADP-heptose:LPS heptosyltransferase
VFKSTGIGDVVIASAIIHDLVDALPDASVCLFAGDDNRLAAELIDGVRVVGVSMARPWRVVRQLRAERLDVLIDLGQWSRVEAICSALGGARYTIGFRTPSQRRHFCYDAAVDHSDAIHELSNFRRAVECLGVATASRPRLAVRTDCDPPAAGPFVVFHPWASGVRNEWKEWPAERWQELAALVGAKGYAVVITGAAGDSRRSSELSRLCGTSELSVVDASGRYSLSEVASVLKAAKAVVSVNTGIMHIAAALGTPTIALNGPTAEGRWAPVGPCAVSVNSDYRDCGYLNLGFEYAGHRADCMEGIRVSAVINALEGLLDSTKR